MAAPGLVCECKTAVLEGWKAIAAALGVSSATDAMRKRLHGWERWEGLPVHRLRGRVFATSVALEAWANGTLRPEQHVPIRRIK